MDASNLGMVETHSAQRGAPRPNPAERMGICLAPRIRAALLALLEAHEYGQDLDRSDWDFAIEIPSLRELKLSNSDLRWLVGRGLIDHAIEITSPGDVDRNFRQSARLLFFRRTCFVLTPRGAELARVLGDGEPRESISRRTGLERPRLPWETSPESIVPSWDRDRQELRVGAAVIKQFKVPAANQETILAAFEEEAWPPRIDDPLPPHAEQSPKRRLQETIKSLNRNQKRPLMRFLGDGSGQGVRWEFRNQGDTRQAE